MGAEIRLSTSLSQVSTLDGRVTTCENNTVSGGSFANGTLTLNKNVGDIHVTGFPISTLEPKYFYFSNNPGGTRWVVSKPGTTTITSRNVYRTSSFRYDSSIFVNNILCYGTSSNSTYICSAYENTLGYDETFRYSLMSDVWYDLSSEIGGMFMLEGETQSDGYARFRNLVGYDNTAWVSQGTQYIDMIFDSSSNRIKINTTIYAHASLEIRLTPFSYVDYIGDSDPGFQ